MGRVVTRLDGELMIKPVVALDRKTLRQLPRNPACAPIEVEHGQNFAVEGVFCGLIEVTR
jgi:repressor LexA